MQTPHKSTILDGKLHVFSRPNSPFLWCGFHHKGQYVRTSTKQRFLPQAEKFAEAWYYDKQFEIRGGGLRIGGMKFSKVAKLALATYEARVARSEGSSEYLSGIRKVLKARVLPFFGQLAVDQIDSQTWSDYKQYAYEKFPTKSSRATLHQHKNAVRVVLNEAEARGWIQKVPVFKDRYVNRQPTQPRSWFEPHEYKRLYEATRANIRRLKGTRHAAGAEELHDYVIFMANTGLRIGEASNVRFCDVEVIPIKDEKGPKRFVLLIKNIKGKRGTGECKSYFGAVSAFKRIVKRRNARENSQDKLFLQHHREMFNKVLERTNLKLTPGQPPARRDLMSLRHTYICFRLLGGASVFDIAVNCRTSVQMIEEHYARRLRARMTSTINRTIAESGFGAERE